MVEQVVRTCTTAGGVSRRDAARMTWSAVAAIYLLHITRILDREPNGTAKSTHYHARIGVAHMTCEAHKPGMGHGSDRAGLGTKKHPLVRGRRKTASVEMEAGDLEGLGGRRTKSTTEAGACDPPRDGLGFASNWMEAVTMKEDSAQTRRTESSTQGGTGLSSPEWTEPVIPGWTELVAPWIESTPPAGTSVGSAMDGNSCDELRRELKRTREAWNVDPDEDPDEAWNEDRRVGSAIQGPDNMEKTEDRTVIWAKRQPWMGAWGEQTGGQTELQDVATKGQATMDPEADGGWVPRNPTQGRI